MAKTYKQLKTELKLGASILTLKKQDSSFTQELGVTTEDVTPLYTEETQYIENTTVTFGTTTVETLYSGETITFVCSVALNDETEEYLSDILEKVDTGSTISLTNEVVERNALINGIRATGFVLNIHPISKKDSSSDINLVNCTCQVVPIRNYDTENNSYLSLVFTAHPAVRDMDSVSYFDAIGTVEGGSLDPSTQYDYKVAALDVSSNETYQAVTVDATTGTTDLTARLLFKLVYGASKYRIWRSDDGGTTWAYLDILEQADNGTIYFQTFDDDGTQTFITGTPVASQVQSLSKVYSTILYGVPLSEVTLESAD